MRKEYSKDKMSKCRSNQGFNKGALTFVEMLLVVSLLSVIAVALYNTFSNGLKVWERANRLVAEEDIAIFLEKLTQDLQSALSFSQIQFDGTKNRLSFATIVRTPADSKKKIGEQAYIDEIGRVEYDFDSLRNALYRRQANYSLALKNKFLSERTLTNIRAMEFKYFYHNGGWQDSAHRIVPSAVRMDIEFGDEKNPRRMTRLIGIPIGS